MIITDYINDESLNLKVDGLVIHNEYSVSTIRSFTDDEALKILFIIKKIQDKGLKAFVLMDKIIYEGELTKLKWLLREIKKTKAYIIYSDYAILNCSEDYMNYLIYYPKTLVCNSKEAVILDTDLFVSNEITFDEILEINNNVHNKNLGIKTFGYLSIFYTKRKLLSLYNDFLEKDDFKSNHVYDLEEEIRTDRYKIYEGSFGTIIFTPFIYALKEEIEKLDNFKYFYIDTQMIDSDKVSKVIDIYNNKDYSLLDSLFPNLGRGFLDIKSILLKGNKDE